MPKLALALYAVFVAVAFGWRSWIQYQRTGDIGFRGVSRSASSVEHAVGASFAILLVAFALLPVGALLGLVSPIAALDRPGVHGAGLVLALLGIGITVLAQVQMGASWRIGVDASELTALVQHGLFRHVRNPIFTGMLLATLGLVLLVPSLAAAAVWLLLAATIEAQVRWVEEPYLSSAHGHGYAEYARQVGRFVPGVGRFS